MRILSVNNNQQYNKNSCYFMAKQQISKTQDKAKDIATGVLLTSGLLLVLDDEITDFTTKKHKASDKAILALACLSVLVLGILSIKDFFLKKEK